MVGLGYPGLPITQLRGIMSKIREELKNRSFNNEGDRYFYKLMVANGNDSHWSPEGFDAALTVVRELNVLELEMPTNETEMFDYVKKMNERAEGFSGIVTLVVTALLMGVLTKEELNAAIDEMLGDIKIKEKIRKF